jgi:hypothetical protein
LGSLDLDLEGEVETEMDTSSVLEMEAFLSEDKNEPKKKPTKDNGKKAK